MDDTPSPPPPDTPGDECVCILGCSKPTPGRKPIYECPVHGHTPPGLHPTPRRALLGDPEVFRCDRHEYASTPERAADGCPWCKLDAVRAAAAPIIRGYEIDGFRTQVDTHDIERLRAALEDT